MGLYLSNLACLTSVICHRLPGTCSCTCYLLASLLRNKLSPRETQTCECQIWVELYCTYACTYVRNIIVVLCRVACGNYYQPMLLPLILAITLTSHLYLLMRSILDSIRHVQISLIHLHLSQAGFARHWKNPNRLSHACNKWYLILPSGAEPVNLMQVSSCLLAVSYIHGYVMFHM